MSDTYFQPGQAASLNPNQYESAPAANDGFAALVKIVSCRFGSTDYPEGSGFINKIALRVKYLSTKGKEFEKSYSTGLLFADLPGQPALAVVSPDGKRLISKSPEFKGFGPSSDAIYFLQKAISSGFPSNSLTDDISIFEGHCFLIADDKNPRWTNSSVKAYPKKYHPEGWDTALASQQAKQAAKQGDSAQMVSTYNVPPVVATTPAAAFDATGVAGATLMEIVMSSGGKVSRNDILQKINDVAGGKGWTPQQRQAVTFALWDEKQLAGVVGKNPALKLDGDTISFI